VSCASGTDLDSSNDVTRISIVLLMYSGGSENCVCSSHSEFEIGHVTKADVPKFQS
jgi:hypothetical protein